MTDHPKKTPNEEFDWEGALDEWEKKAFVPELAEDKDTKRPAQPLATAGDRPSRPLYRPPTGPVLQSQRKAPPVSAATPTGTEPPPEFGQIDANLEVPPPEDQPRTLMVDSPRSATGPVSGRPSSAGLGQLFGKTPDEHPRDEVDVLLDAADEFGEKTEVADRDELLATTAEGPRARLPSTVELQASDVELIGPARLASAASSGGDEVTLGDRTVRKHDPNAETQAYRDEEPTAARTSPRGYEGEEPTKFYVSQTPSARPEAAPKNWLSPAAQAAFEARAAWLEAEARAMTNDNACARTLLAVSEIRMLLGDPEGAHPLAIEAREKAPGNPLAHRQVRATFGPAHDPSELLDALDREASSGALSAAELHANLLGADVARLAGDDAGALERWRRALRLSTEDPRAALSLAGLALHKGDLVTAEALRQQTAAASIADGLGTALRLRGVESAPKPPAGHAASANDAFRRARKALDSGDSGAAAEAVAELAAIAELAPAARWLSAALGSTRDATRATAARALAALVDDHDDLARRLLAGCAVELNDKSLLRKALDGGDFSIADESVLDVLMNGDGGDDKAQEHEAALAETEALLPLASALAAVRSPPPGEDADAKLRRIQARAGRAAGARRARAAVRIARLLTTGAPADSVQAAVQEEGDLAPVESNAVTLELAVRAGRFGEVSDALKGWERGGDKASEVDHLLASALIAEISGDKDRALAAYREARKLDEGNEAILRAESSLDAGAELPQALNALADSLGEGVRGAITRIEAVVREPNVEDATRIGLLERAHEASPTLPIAGFLAERLARRSGNVDEVLRWIRERRKTASDPLEHALDAVREALLVADQDPELASEQLQEAHKTRTNDVALRELYERLTGEPPPDRGTWREQRAALSAGDARALYYMEAAHEYERMGDKAAALRAAEAAVASGDTMLARLARERAEVEGGSPARLADELLTHARATEDTRERREAYERLADLDATGRADTSSAMLWHRSILEETPDHEPSLRHIEHALVTDGRLDELDPIVTSIARALSGSPGGEAGAHADLAARLRSRGATGEWEATREVAEIGAKQPEPTLGSLRLLNAHARWKHDEEAVLSASLALVERVSRPPETATLLLRAGEASARIEKLEQARELLERAKNEDAGDVVVWQALVDARRRGDDPRGAAEAAEGLARTSAVREHQLAAWYDAGRLWLDAVQDIDRGVAALEQAAVIDVKHADVYGRLAAIYTQRGARNELAALLERRIATVSDAGERVAMEVERGQALLEIGDMDAARVALDKALAENPDHTGALASMAELCAKQRDWTRAEQAWVQLARLLSTPEEQRAVYARLGELYSVHSVNLARAELALKEVLKRAPGDVATMEQLVDIYKRQNDGPHAIEIVQELVTQSKDAAQRRKRLIELAAVHEEPGHDLRKAEQVLESARREAPTDVAVLRALAEFYIRHKQMPAVHILLDRAAADARRAFSAGRFAPALFEVMRAVFELRGKHDASQVVGASLAALDGQPAVVRGAEARGLDPRFDELLAPEVLSPPLRALLAKTGDALDAAAPLDLRALHVAPLPASAAALQSLVSSLAGSVGLGSVQLLVSSQLARACVPASSSPATILVGDGLLSAPNERARAFLLARALKLVMAHASALVRTPASELLALVSAWLQAFNPIWKPQGVNPTALANAAKRVGAALPKKIAPEVGVMALEVAGALGNQAASLGANALAWANRAALLSIGDPNAALDAISWSHSGRDAPTDAKDRASWVARTHEAKDLLAFSVSDQYSEARSRLGLDR